MFPSSKLQLNQDQKIPVYFALLSPGEFFDITWIISLERKSNTAVREIINSTIYTINHCN